MIPSRRMLTGWALFALMAGCLGCSSQPVSGVVEEQPGLAVGSCAHDIPFTASNGKPTTLHAIRQPVAILAFVDMPGEACCAMKSEVADLCVRFSRLPVTVVQVCMPTDPCAHSSGEREMCQPRKSGPVVLCDRDAIARVCFGRPSSGTLILIDKYGIIAAVSDMSDLSTFLWKAERLALEEANRHLD